MTGVKALVLRPVVNARPKARREGGGKTQRHRHLFDVEAQNAARGRGRAEGTAGPRRMKARRVVGFVGAAGLERTTRHVVAEKHRRDEFLPGDHAVDERKGREDGRHDDGARVVAPARVVEFEGVRGRAVHERRDERRAAAVVAPEHRAARAFARHVERRHEACDFNGTGSGDPGADGIENVALGLFHHVGGNGFEGRFNDELREDFTFQSHGCAFEGIEWKTDHYRTEIRVRAQSPSHHHRKTARGALFIGKQILAISQNW